MDMILWIAACFYASVSQDANNLAIYETELHE